MDDERFWDIDINKHRSASMMLEFAASSVPSGHHRHTGDTSSAGLELGGVLQNSIRRKLGREELVGVGVFFSLHSRVTLRPIFIPMIIGNENKTNT